MSEYWGFEGPDYDCEPDRDCSDCGEKEEKLESVRNFVEGVLEYCYTDKHDHRDFEKFLDEICAYLDLELPRTEIRVRKIPTVSILEEVDGQATRES